MIWGEDIAAYEEKEKNKNHFCFNPFDNSCWTGAAYLKEYALWSGSHSRLVPWMESYSRKWRLSHP